jgi:hypothetical protein
MAVASTMRHEQHDAVAGLPPRIVERPHAVPVEAHESFDPGIAAVEIGPLVGEAQVRLDDPAADRLEIDHAGAAREVPGAPGTAPRLDRRLGRGAHFPIVERAVAAGDSARMPPPLRHAVDQRHVAADVITAEQGRPEMTRLVMSEIVRFRAESPAADAHALQVVDGFGKDRIVFGGDTVRCSIEPLTHRNCELVVNPAMGWIPRPGVTIFRGDQNVGRTRDVLEVLSAPWVDFTNRHLFPFGLRSEASICRPR